MKRIEVIDNDEVYGRAARQREVFYGKPVKEEKELAIQWPTFVKYLGKTNAQIYYSNKMLNGGDWELYKHIAEGPQDLYICDSITTLLNDQGQPIRFVDVGARENKGRGIRRNPRDPSIFYAPTYALSGPLPKYVSDLAESKGLQWQSEDNSFWEVRIPRTTWASAVHPRTREVMLIMYSNEGIHFIVTGSKLDIKKDGIVG
jgi:hypothetical protein